MAQLQLGNITLMVIMQTLVLIGPTNWGAHNSDKFSSKDIFFHNQANNTFSDYTDALGTPRGDFWKIFGRVNGPDDAEPL